MDVSHLIVGIGSLIAGFSEISKGVKKPDIASAPLGSFGKGYPLPPSAKQVNPQYKATIRQAGSIDNRVGYILDTIKKGRKDPRMRAFAVSAVSQKCGSRWCVPERDYWGEVKALFGAVRNSVRYVRDIYKVDTFQAPHRTLEFAGGDCFPEGTLLLTDDYRLVPVENVHPGMKIWGYDKFSKVTNFWSKGKLPVTRIKLNNGSELELTEDHKVYVAECSCHDQDRKSGPCSCGMKGRNLKRIPVSELKEGMVLLQPDKIDAAGKDYTDKSIALAELTGLYLADGWTDKYRIGIAGKDGFPKEEQKHRVQKLGNILGLNTSLYARVYGKDLSKSLLISFSQYGTHAFNKFLPNLRYSYGEANALLTGILANSGKHTNSPGRTLSTTSRILAVQARILHKMLGINCSSSFVEDHGGLGSHPLWRISSREEGSKKLLRVKKIWRNVREALTYDISTDDHFVYLPEFDVTVSNCDDYTITLGSALQSIGYPIKIRIVQSTDSPDFNHIFLLVGLPPREPSKWYALDASLNKPAGWSPPKHMLKRTKDYDIS